MNSKVLKVIKIAVPVASVLVTIGTSYLSGKELDDKVSKKVAEALAKTSTEEA